VDQKDRAIINHLQGGFPICERPYLQVAQQLGIGEDELLSRLRCLLDDKILSRFGPMYHAEKLGGGLTLAALAVPLERFGEVTEIVNRFPEVAHNYQREHTLNMWFVLATETPERIGEVMTEIETRTGLRVFNLPKEQEYFVGLRLEV
jgi:DNA-binding Lrp family transcriptional regulator